MKKIIFLEGLPNVGKTTIVNAIKSKNIKDIHVVDEVILPTDDMKYLNSQQYFMDNDIYKINQYDSGLIIIDRGLISTLSYNQASKIINENKDFEKVNKWFLENSELYNSDDSVTIYLKRKKEDYSLTEDSVYSPYGTVENQKLLESITLYNCKKYCKNFILKNYDQDNMEALINEIIDKFMCS